MTIKELIKILQEFDPDMEVKLGYNSGDYWGNVVCKKISDAGVRSVEYSDYHRMDKIADTDEDEENYTDGATRKIVVLN
jgi:hypothetical protein